MVGTSISTILSIKQVRVLRDSSTQVDSILNSSREHYNASLELEYGEKNLSVHEIWIHEGLRHSLWFSILKYFAVAKHTPVMTSTSSF